MVFCFIGLTSSVHAQHESIEKEHKALFQSIKAIQVDFEQILFKSLRGRTINREGRAYFAKPNRFRWDFQSELLGNEEFYYDGQTLTHFREKEKMVTRYKANIGLAKELNQVVNLILDPKNLLRKYDIKEKKSIKKDVELTLIPKQIKVSEILSITVRIADQKKYIRRVKIDYVNRNYTEFKFDNPNFSPIKSKIFNFSRKGKFTVLDQG